MDIKDFEDKATALRRGPLKAKSLLMATSPLGEPQTRTGSVSLHLRRLRVGNDIPGPASRTGGRDHALSVFVKGMTRMRLPSAL